MKRKKEKLAISSTMCVTNVYSLWKTKKKKKNAEAARGRRREKEKEEEVHPLWMIGCGTGRGELYYMDLASDSEAKVGQAFKI
ncbi:unnamed protein product [Prunus brigantina]